MAFPAQPPDLRRLGLGRKSFAVSGPLALLGTASYPVSVRRLDGFATPLLSALPSRSAPCGSLRSLRPGSGGTLTLRPSPMLGIPQKKHGALRGRRVLNDSPLDCLTSWPARAPGQRRGSSWRPASSSRQPSYQQSPAQAPGPQQASSQQQASLLRSLRSSSGRRRTPAKPRPPAASSASYHTSPIRVASLSSRRTRAPPKPAALPADPSSRPREQLRPKIMRLLPQTCQETRGMTAFRRARVPPARRRAFSSTDASRRNLNNPCARSQ